MEPQIWKDRERWRIHEYIERRRASDMEWIYTWFLFDHASSIR